MLTLLAGGFLILIPLPLLLVCGAVVFNGIAAARDEHHRMTPQSPWFYFDRKVRRHRWRIIICALIPVSFPLVLEFGFPSFTMGFAPMRKFWFYASGLSSFLPLLLIPLAVIVRFAPRFERLTSLLLVAMPCGVLYFGVVHGILAYAASIGNLTLFFEVAVANAPKGMTSTTYYPWFNMAAAGAVMLLLTGTVLHVRFILGERWFFPGESKPAFGRKDPQSHNGDSNRA